MKKCLAFRWTSDSNICSDYQNSCTLIFLPSDYFINLSAICAFCQSVSFNKWFLWFVFCWDSWNCCDDCSYVYLKKAILNLPYNETGLWSLYYFDFIILFYFHWFFLQLASLPPLCPNLYVLYVATYNLSLKRGHMHYLLPAIGKSARLFSGVKTQTLKRH